MRQGVRRVPGANTRQSASGCVELTAARSPTSTHLNYELVSWGRDSSRSTRSKADWPTTTTTCTGTRSTSWTRTEGSPTVASPSTGRAMQAGTPVQPPRRRSRLPAGGPRGEGLLLAEEVGRLPVAATQHRSWGERALGPGLPIYLCHLNDGTVALVTTTTWHEWCRRMTPLPWP